jgi:hypothetical protein
MLVKATMLQSGTKIGGSVPPDSTQGYGRLTLTNVFPLASSTFSLFVDDSAIAAFNERIYKVRVLNGNSDDLKVSNALLLIASFLSSNHIDKQNDINNNNNNNNYCH